eukprot:g17737.t1
MAQSLTHSVALGSMPLSVMSAGHEDLLLLARELPPERSREGAQHRCAWESTRDSRMTLSLLHETELRRIVDKYPLVNELQPELPSLSASRMSQLNSPYYDEKSDGSEGIPCALFQSEPQVSAEPPPHSHSPILESWGAARAGRGAKTRVVP